MRSWAMAIGLVVLVLLGSGAGYLVGRNAMEPEATTATKTLTFMTSNTATTTVTSLYADLGSHLQLRIELNSSVVRSGGIIKAVVTLFNPFDANLTAAVLTSSNSAIASWSWYDYICGGGTLDEVFGFAVFQGHFGAGNLSAAGSPLTLAPPLHPPCVVHFSPSLLVFMPASSDAWAYIPDPQWPPSLLHTTVNATTEVCESASGGQSCGPTSGLFGYWNDTMGGPMGNYTTSSPGFHYFPPGPYTLVAEDTWGHQAFEYFEVV